MYTTLTECWSSYRAVISQGLKCWNHSREGEERPMSVTVTWMHFVIHLRAHAQPFEISLGKRRKNPQSSEIQLKRKHGVSLSVMKDRFSLW